MALFSSNQEISDGYKLFWDSLYNRAEGCIDREKNQTSRVFKFTLTQHSNFLHP